MSRIAVLETDDDLAWLFEGHLKNHEAAKHRLLFGSAIVYGNEDWPVRIELYSDYSDPDRPYVIEPVYPPHETPLESWRSWRSTRSHNAH